MIGQLPTEAPPSSFVTHLECARCGVRADHHSQAHLCTACGGPLLVRYDLQRMKSSVPRNVLYGRRASMASYPRSI